MQDLWTTVSPIGRARQKNYKRQCSCFIEFIIAVNFCVYILHKLNLFTPWDYFKAARIINHIITNLSYDLSPSTTFNIFIVINTCWTLSHKWRNKRLQLWIWLFFLARDVLFIAYRVYTIFDGQSGMEACKKNRLRSYVSHSAM